MTKIAANKNNMNEFDLIQNYFNTSSLSFSHPQVDLGIGDDCAIVSVPADQQLCMSIDTLVEEVHFPKGARAFDIATRALCVTLSDLAAMGAQPIGFTLAISLPQTLKQDANWLREFSEGLALIAQRYQCPLIGGDTTKSSTLVLTLQVHGTVPKQKALTRSGAQVGDRVCVTANQTRGLGDGAAALPFVLSDPQTQHALASAFWQPLPQIELGQTLRDLATSCLDVSDGLVQDLNHICQASQVSMQIDPERLPLSHALLQHCDRPQAQAYALGGGDDYQLAFTLPSGVAVPADCVEVGVVVASANASTNISANASTNLFKHQVHLPATYQTLEKGYQHF